MLHCFWQFNEHKDQAQCGDNGRDHHVRPTHGDKVGHLHGLVGFRAIDGKVFQGLGQVPVHDRWQHFLVLRMQRTLLTAKTFGMQTIQDDRGGHEHPGEGAYGIECLCQVEPASRGFRVPHG